MIVIAFNFLAGRYHATPWGRHVNEGAVEWPPSPWRILRALIAAWKRTLPNLPERNVKPIFECLAEEAPEFVLPRASTGHTRHFMPWFKKGPDGRTLVFDTFVAVPPEAKLLVRWPNALLDDAHRDMLRRILTNLNTLGRSESWCTADLGDDTAVSRLTCSTDEENLVCAPLDGREPPPTADIIRLLCADPSTAFNNPHACNGSSHGPRRRRAETALYDPAWNLCMETLQLHRERWSDPPGSRWVQYTRPRDCFEIKPAERPRARSLAHPRIQVARYALDSTVLPLATETLPVAEAARRRLMSIYGRITERNGVRGRSPVFSGKDERGRPLTGHGHAFYLPTDEDGDGRLDHLTVFARSGFDDAERRAVDQLRKLNTGRKGEERHPLRLLLLGMGTLEEYHPGPLERARVWVSATPYIATRHAKTRGRQRIDMASPLARAEFLTADLREQIRGVLPDLSIDASEVQIEPLLDGGAFKVANRWRPIQFKRFRSKSADDGGHRLAGAFRIRFPRLVCGPVVLGYSSHFGMGFFVPEQTDNRKSGGDTC